MDKASATRSGEVSAAAASAQLSLFAADAASPTAKPTWTPRQLEAIRTTGRNILVSAAAGSGKTSVLAERCAYLVCDAPPDERCDVNELLVVTFTVAAAQEMRTRIADALHKRYEQTHDERLARQLALIDRAQIGTIDGFCSAVVRQWFHVLELDPAFQMLSEDEGLLMRAEVARQLVEDRYASDNDGAFQRLVDRYADGNDASLRQKIMRAADLMGSLVRPRAWISKSRQRIADAADKPLRESELGRLLLDRMRRQLDAQIARGVRLAGQLRAHERLAKYLDDITEIIAVLTSWRETLARGDVSRLAEQVKELKLDRMPTITRLSPGEAPMRVELMSIRKLLKEGELATTLCRFSEDEWRAGMRQIAEPANVFLDLVEQFADRYRQAKTELRALDFADLERLALRALSERDGGDEPTLVPSAAARAYRQQFRHVLVDEYQDINELQDSILALVSRDRCQFCVGDVKQSIYRFRLADPQRFLARYKRRLEAEQVIDLQTNFRSRAPLLATLNGIFAAVMTEQAGEIEYDESQYLAPREDSPYLARPIDGPHVELHLLPTEPAAGSDDDHSDAAAGGTNGGDGGGGGDDDADDELERAEREAAFIASRIAELMGNGDPSRAARVLVKSPDAGGEPIWRPIQFRDIVVLLRSMKFKAEQFADVLRSAGVPAHSDAGTGFFEATEVRDVLALLQVLDNQRQDIPLAAVLRSPLAAIAQPEDALAKIRMAYRGKPEVPFHLAVVRYAAERDDALAARLRDVLADLSEWRELARRRPLAEALWQIYDRSGYLAFCEGLADGEQRVANLVALFERAREFSSFRKQGLGRFMRFLDTLSSQTDLAQPSTASEADDVVRIMSVHGSKGLEFPVVFVPDLGKRHNVTDSRGHILVDRETGVGLSVCDEGLRVRYPSLASTVVSERLRRQMLAEEMRILYVATTRARERLILVGTCKPDLPAKWDARWAGHVGSIPPDDALAGNCMLDWLGPASSVLAGSAGVSLERTAHDRAPTAEIVQRRRPGLSPRQKKLSALEPLESPPGSSPSSSPLASSASPAAREVDALWKRLTTPYAHEAFTKVPASGSVTGLSRQAPIDPPDPEDFEPVAAARDGFVFAEPLRTPRAGAQTVAPTAADIGSATHVLLEHLDFSRPCALDDLREQLNRLVDARLLSPELAAHVDLEAVAWFMTSELGSTLRRHAALVRREVSINFPVPHPQLSPQQNASTDPMDRLMIRGRLDLLVPLQSGSIIVDFKTDRVDAAGVEARLGHYRAQLHAYRDAVAAMLGWPVAESWLVFLSPRIVQAV